MRASYWATRLNAATDSAKRVFAERAAVGVQFRDEAGVLRRIGGDRDAGEVLGRAAQHRRAADVDVLDDLVQGRVRIRRHPLERIQVQHQQVDRRDAVFGHHRIVGAGAAEQAAVHDRVQRLHPAVHHFREAGGLADVLHREPGLAQGLRGAAGREQFHAVRGQRAGEVDQSGLVGHGQQRA